MGKIGVNFSFNLTRTDHISGPNGRWDVVNRDASLSERDIHDIIAALEATDNWPLARQLYDVIEYEG